MQTTNVKFKKDKFATNNYKTIHHSPRTCYQLCRPFSHFFFLDFPSDTSFSFLASCHFRGLDLQQQTYYLKLLEEILLLCLSLEFHLRQQRRNDSKKFNLRNRERYSISHLTGRSHLTCRCPAGTTTPCRPPVKGAEEGVEKNTPAGEEAGEETEGVTNLRSSLRKFRRFLLRR